MSIFNLPQEFVNEPPFIQVLGLVIGGFVAAGPGWRWMFWLLAILGGVAGVTALVILREIHLKIILEYKAARLHARTGRLDLHSRLASNDSLLLVQVLLQVLIRPIILLF